MAPQLKSGNRVLYFYGVTRRPLNGSIAQAGVDLQSEVECIECEGLACWVSRVSAIDFQKNLAPNMENLDWLATAGVAHQHAIAAIARASEILPARFGTVFRNEQSLRNHIREHIVAIKADFRRIKDADEFGIKVFGRHESQPQSTQVRSGKDYLKAKAALLPRRRSGSVNGDFGKFAKALGQVALDSAPAGNVSSGQRGLRFQTSLLVKRKDRKRLESVLKKFSRRWVDSCRIECSGPWPPYSFVSRRQGTDSK